jgi:hypothetical protein
MVNSMPFPIGYTQRQGYKMAKYIDKIIEIRDTVALLLKEKEAEVKELRLLLKGLEGVTKIVPANNDARSIDTSGGELSVSNIKPQYTNVSTFEAVCMVLKGKINGMPASDIAVEILIEGVSKSDVSVWTRRVGNHLWKGFRSGVFTKVRFGVYALTSLVVVSKEVKAPAEPPLAPISNRNVAEVESVQLKPLWEKMYVPKI